MTHTWTRERPTQAGWYWWRTSNEHSPEVVHFVQDDIVMLAGDGRVYNAQRMVNGMAGDWAGPIEPPKERGES